MTKTGFFPSKDGTQLYGEWYATQGTARAGAVVMHGYDDHGGRYVEVSNLLADAGFATLAIDYRGHGRAAGRRGHCQRFDEYLDDLRCACEQVDADELVLVCHSHGALIALVALCQPGALSKRVKGAVLSSPFLGLNFEVPQLKAAVGKLMSKLWPSLALQTEIEPQWLSHDPKIVEARRVDTLCHKVATARWFTESSAAHEWVKRNAGRITLPTLWLVAGADRLVNPSLARETFVKSGGQKKLHVYDDFFHEVFNEVERQRPFDDMRSWLSSLFPDT